MAQVSLVFLLRIGVSVVEVCRPNRQLRRRKGKSDPTDAEAAARAVLSGEEMGTPKTQDGPVESMRLLRAQRRSAIKARTQVSNQLHSTLSTAPEELRSRFSKHTISALVKTAVVFRVGLEVGGSLSTTCRLVLRGLSRRWRFLNEEVKLLDKQLTLLVKSTAPQLLAEKGVGTEVASALLVAAGDNPERLSTEASFAALCGVSPVDASSGKQHRHRLNRDANRALWVIAFVRSRCDERTKAYIEKRTKDGLSRMEILRCLKRYIARDVFRIILRTRDAAATVDT